MSANRYCSKGPCVFVAFSCPRIVSSDSSFCMFLHGRSFGTVTDVCELNLGM